MTRRSTQWLFAAAAIVSTLALVHSPAAAQSVGTINGYVVDDATQETMVGATVRIKGTKLGSITNKSGFFAIVDVPSGRRTVIVSYVGYQTREYEVDLRPGGSEKVTIAIRQKATVNQVTVVGERDSEKRQIDVSRVNVPVEQLKQLRIGGEADVFRSLQYLPGVLTSSQISSGLYIRGGSPDQNLVLIDGSTVYNPTHLLGFFSSFNADAIKDVDMIKGGFPAEYGGRLSAVLALTQKDGNRNEFEGLASLGLISSRATLQGPIGNGSWFLGGRRTYIDLLMKAIPEDKENPLPSFNFYDVNGKITQDLGSNDRLSLSGFASADDLSLDGNDLEFNIGIGNWAGALRWTHIFGDNLFTTFNLSGSRYYNSFDGNQSGFEFGIENIITDYTAKGTLEWYLSDGLAIKGGFESTRYIFDYLKNFSGDRDSSVSSGTITSATANLTVYDWAHAGFLQANVSITDLLSAQFGLRSNFSGLSDRVTWDPRAAVRYQLQDNIAIKAAWGVYHQYLHLASLPDFSFFDTWLPTDSTVNTGTSTQYIVSLETEPIDGYDLNIEGYYKKLENINEVNQFTTNTKTVSDVFYEGNGEAFGAEIFLQKRVGDFTGWAGYALGFINARFDSVNHGRWFRPKYDRRHDLKFVGQYKLNDRWEIGASFAFQSGQSYTGVTSRFESSLPGETNGTAVTVPADRYGLRLPPSHQLNINANYSSTIFGLPMRLLIDIYNVYSRRDIWFRYYDATGAITEVVDVRLLPILPTVAIEVKF